HVVWRAVRKLDAEDELHLRISVHDDPRVTIARDPRATRDPHRAQSLLTHARSPVARTDVESTAAHDEPQDREGRPWTYAPACDAEAEEDDANDEEEATDAEHHPGVLVALREERLSLTAEDIRAARADALPALGETRERGGDLRLKLRAR